MTILALDLGTFTGYALRSPEGRITHGTQHFMQRRKWHPGQRWSDYRAWLSKLIETEQVTLIAVEDVRRHNGTTAGHVYGAYRSMTEMVAQQHNIRMAPVGVGVIKKSWTGKGNAAKVDMMSEARLRGFSPVDDNAADALAILHWAIASELKEAA